MSGDRAFAVVIAVFATIVYGAVLFSSFGVISVLIDVEPIQSAAAGPLVGPTMFTVASVVLFVFLAWLGMTAPPQNPPTRGRKVRVWRSILAGVVTFLVFLVTGGILLAGSRGSVAVVDHVWRMLGSPFAISTGVLAFLFAILYQLVIAGRYRDRAQPQWPWERNE